MSILEDIAQDTVKLREAYKQNNRFGSFEQQLMSQLLAFDKSEQMTATWLENVEGLLTASAAEMAQKDERIAALEAENAELKAAAAPVLTMLPDEVSDPVDEIAGHKRPPIHAVDNVG